MAEDSDPRTFLDTNVIVYLFSDDMIRAKRAEALLLARPVISTQVVNEFVSVCCKKLGFDRSAASRCALELMAGAEVVPVTALTVRRALHVGERYRLSHWDALIVAAAQLAQCSVLFSEDLQPGQVIDRLQIRNPFT